MEKRTFGKTGLQVSVLGFGGAPVGYLETEQSRVASILHLLLDQGVNLIDTAASYPGSEEAIGRAVHRRRDEFVLVSKCGAPGKSADNEAWSADALSRSIDRSLQRLETDWIDVMLLHSCDLETLQRGDALAALVQAREQGKVRFVGYSGDNQAAAYATALPDVVVLQTSVNICDQANLAAVLPLAEQCLVGVIAKRPIANAAWKDLGEQPGLYADYAKTYTERLARMQITPAELGFEGDPRRVWPEIALRFTLSQPGVHAAIIGTTDPEHARANLEIAAKGPLADAAVQALRAAFARAEADSGQSWTAQF